MTLDEAIEFHFEQSKEEAQWAIDYGKLTIECSFTEEERESFSQAMDRLFKWAEFHKQIAEWIRELKMNRENKSRWVYDENTDNLKCEKCGHIDTNTPLYVKVQYRILADVGLDIDTKYIPNFCPNCGADMRIGGDE